MKNLLIIIIALFTISCKEKKSTTVNRIEEKAEKSYKPNPKSIALNNKALEITMFHRGDSIKVDSAIMLLDKATNLDSLYFLGYANKIPFLMIRRDFPRLLETNKRIRDLKPNQPNWIIQKGLILELSGKIDQANYEYKKGVEGYKDILDSHPNLSWEFKLEFAQSLIIANQYERAKDIVDKLKNEYPDLEIWEEFELQTKDELLHSMNKKRP